MKKVLVFRPHPTLANEVAFGILGSLLSICLPAAAQTRSTPFPDRLAAPPEVQIVSLQQSAIDDQTTNIRFQVRSANAIVCKINIYVDDPVNPVQTLDAGANCANVPAGGARIAGTTAYEYSRALTGLPYGYRNISIEAREDGAATGSAIDSRLLHVQRLQNGEPYFPIGPRYNSPINYDYAVAPSSCIFTAIADGSFESYATTTYSYAPASGAWQFGVNSGVQANGSIWSAPAAPDGTKTAFIGTSGYILQNVCFAEAGEYKLRFKTARRQGQLQPLQLSVDGIRVIGTVAPVSNAFDAYEIPFTISATGAHELKLEATITSSDFTSFVDQVSIVPADAPVACTTSPLEIANAGFEGVSQYPWVAAGPAPGAAGIQANGSGFTVPNAPEGTKTGYLKRGGQLQQTICIPEPGQYRVKFKAVREALTPSGLIHVRVNGVESSAFANVGATVFSDYELPFYATAGSKTFALAMRDDANYSTVFIDALSLDQVPYSTTVCDGQVQNGSFEFPVLAVGALSTDSLGTGWKFSGEPFATVGVRNSGYGSNPLLDPTGAQYLTLGSNNLGGSATQTVCLKDSGTYTLAYRVRASGTAKLSATNDWIGSRAPVGLTPNFVEKSVTFNSPFSNQTLDLKFEAGSSSISAAPSAWEVNIDNVRIFAGSIAPLENPILLEGVLRAGRAQTPTVRILNTTTAAIATSSAPLTLRLAADSYARGWRAASITISTGIAVGVLRDVVLPTTAPLTAGLYDLKYELVNATGQVVQTLTKVAISVLTIDQVRPRGTPPDRIPLRGSDYSDDFPGN